MKRFKSFGAGLATVVAVTGTLVLGGAEPVSAATINVAPGLVGIAPSDGCSLIEAIINANNNSLAHPECAAGTGDDTIVLAPDSTYTIAAPYASSSNGLPVVVGTLTIEGQGATIERQSGLAFRFFQLESATATSLAIDQLTLKGGTVSGEGGGAVFANAPTSSITIRNSTLTENVADGGGAILAEGSLTIENSTISGNTSSLGGGGVVASNGSVTIENSTLSENTAANSGGAILAFQAGVTITNSTISGNMSMTSGAGLAVENPFTTTDIDVSHSTFVGNTGTNTISVAGAAAFELSDSIISGQNPTCSGVFTLAGTNIATDGSCGTASLGTGTLLVRSAGEMRLESLANNGGPTQTHALLAGSPAIDAATGVSEATDQRGVSRPQGAARDVGAFEYVPPAPAPGPSFSRVQGADRYATAAALSAATFAPGIDTVFVVTGDDYPDGLTAGAIAGSLDVPVLLVRTGSIPAATANELTRLAPAEIVVVGGPTVIDDTVVTALDAFTDGPVTRIFGPNRFATAAALSAEYVAAGVDEVYVATGADFADALTAAAAAGANDTPVLLVTLTSIPAATATELTRLAPDRITIIGGPTAIADSVETALAPFASVGVTRVFGADRYATAAAVSAHAFTRAATVHLATGVTFPDALAAGPAAAMAPGPILLSRTTCIPTVTDTEIDRLDATRVVLLGGTTALAAPVATGTTCP